ncbi:sulfotransferase [Gammaproteobacteria bacterium]|nr:sulfotransferase [Gammaproteobacteria bacterium]
MSGVACQTVMVKKVIYITSLAHSGSTLLNLLLGANEDTVAVGEVSQTLKALYKKNRFTRKCSCGQLIPDCPLWGNVYNRMLGTGSLSYGEQFQIMLEEINRFYGENIAVIESSKAIDPLMKVNARHASKLSTIYLIRDVRGYVYAAYARQSGSRATAKFAAVEAFRWFRENRAIKIRLNAAGIPFFQLGYEELCSQPAKMFNALTEFTGVYFDPGIPKPSLVNSHIWIGNRMRNNKQKMSGIHYDDSWARDEWFKRQRWVMWPYLGWNKKNVYINRLGALSAPVRR